MEHMMSVAVARETAVESGEPQSLLYGGDARHAFRNRSVSASDSGRWMADREMRFSAFRSLFLIVVH
jgi:hypothetical protein